MSILSLEDVRPGDIMLASQSSRPSRTLINSGEWLLHQDLRIGDFTVGHAAIVVPGNKLVEAMPHGARIRDLTPADWSTETVFIRLPEDYPGQAEDAAAIAMAMIDTPYSFFSYAYIAAFLATSKAKFLNALTNLLAKRINRRKPAIPLTLPSGRILNVALPIEEICSVLVEQAWSLTGKKVIIGTAPQVVTPGMLGIQLWERLGVIKGAFWFILG